MKFIWVCGVPDDSKDVNTMNKESNIRFTHGNMFSIPADVQINTVNCVGAMGKGVALAFKRKYPQMYREYREECLKGNIVTGKMYLWNSPNGTCIINFPTKDDWRAPSRYSYIDGGLIDLRKCLSLMKDVQVAIPPLGCGNGGLNWDRVKPMIKEHLSGLDATIYVFEPTGGG